MEFFSRIFTEAFDVRLGLMTARRIRKRRNATVKMQPNRLGLKIYIYSIEESPDYRPTVPTRSYSHTHTLKHPITLIIRVLIHCTILEI